MVRLFIGRFIALAAVLAVVIVGVGVLGHGTADAAGFYIQGFRNWNGQWCTGLFNGAGQLLSYWGCY